MRADTIELLTGKGRFQTEQAVVVAEAIDMTIEDAQLVTTPILNARFVEFEARFSAFEAKMEARFAAFEAQMNARFAAFEAQMNARFVAFEAQMEARFAAFEAQMEARFAAFEARMDQKFDRLRLQLILAIILSNLAMGPLGVALLEAVKRLL